jgi:DNA-binding response OmpR family regulator
MVDLILLDIEMPGMSGFQFLEKMYQDHPDNKKVPVIFVTSHTDSDIITHALNAGARDYIVKPIKSEVLLKKIAAIITLPMRKTAHEEDCHGAHGGKITGTPESRRFRGQRPVRDTGARAVGNDRKLPWGCTEAAQ